VRIGICFDRIEEYNHIDGPADRFAEFEPESTIEAMQQAILRCGHDPILLGGPFELLKGKPEVDVIWNIAEGYGSRNREGWVPSLCEMYNIPFLGSDALTLSLSLDKVATKQLARSIGIPTSNWMVMPVDGSAAPELQLIGPFPLFAKPRYEGTAKGITERSILADEAAAKREVARLLGFYGQDVLIEQFLPGAEYTVAVTGTPLHAHPVMERGVDESTGIGYHVMDALGKAGRYRLGQNLSAEIEEQLQRWSVQLCTAMQVRDFARLDFKCDSDGNPFFLEINPLPTFAVDNTFAILAEIRGEPYEEFLAGVLKQAINRVTA